MNVDVYYIYLQDASDEPLPQWIASRCPRLIYRVRITLLSIIGSLKLTILLARTLAWTLLIQTRTKLEALVENMWWVCWTVKQSIFDQNFTATVLQWPQVKTRISSSENTIFPSAAQPMPGCADAWSISSLVTIKLFTFIKFIHIWKCLYH